ncbi:MAG TPA: hypothetical protein VHE53_03920 [Patescibacteria group bacterium]|nr:hypothetical protein [Patescibacteria group bacterium]
MKKIGLIIIVVIVLASVYLLFGGNKMNIQSPSVNTTTVSPTNIQPTIDNSDLKAGESSYSDPQATYTFLYPSDYKLDTTDPKHIRIYKRNESQRPQSEMTNGALIVFETIDLSGMSLESWVNMRIKQNTADGTTKLTEPKKAITQNGYPGFSYSLQDQGESQNIVLEKDHNSKNAVFISYSINDPEQKGYQEEVNAILASLKLLK